MRHMTRSQDMAMDVRNARTFLFVPGSRPDRFDKAAASEADVVIIDLEDAVASDHKIAARTAAASWLLAGGSAAVRVNPPGTTWFADDLPAARKASAILLPKAESAREVAAVVAVYDDLPLIPLIETAVGLQRLAEIAAVPGVTRLAFGNVDLAADLGVDPSSQAALLTARSQIVYASAAAGLEPPIDGVTTAVHDEESLNADAAHARELGFMAKLVIHPSQVRTVARIMNPTTAEIAWAEGVLGYIENGVSIHDGHMIDEPVLRRARRLLARADQIGTVSPQD